MGTWDLSPVSEGKDHGFRGEGKVSPSPMELMGLVTGRSRGVVAAVVIEDRGKRKREIGWQRL